MNINKQHAPRSAEGCRENNPLLLFTMTGYWNERMWENYSDL